MDTKMVLEILEKWGRAEEGLREREA